MVIERSEPQNVEKEAGFENKYRMLFETSRDGIALMDAETGFIVDCNKEYENLTNRSLEELKTMRVWETRPPNQQKRGKAVFFEIVNNGIGGAELDYVREDGYAIHSEFISRLLTINGKRFIQSVVRDNTERVNREKELDQYRHHLEKMVGDRTKELNRTVLKLENSIFESNLKKKQIIEYDRKLRKLTQGYIKVQEDERNRIAIELHDRVVQDLINVCHQLSEIDEDRDKITHTNIKAAIKSVKNILGETRAVMKTLYPTPLTEYGLRETIKQELDSLKNRMGVSVIFIAHVTTRYIPVLETTIYRIFHEAMVNTERHSLKAANVQVRLEEQDNFIQLTINDDGVGFRTDRGSLKEPKGISGMRQRAELVGTFELRSDAGKGTLLFVKIPFNQ